jgi:hypothetical protein
VSTTTVGVEEIAPVFTVVTEPTTTSSAPTTTFGFALNIADLQRYDLQQYEAPTITVARAEPVHSNIIVPKKAESSGGNAQFVLFVIIGALVMGAVVFIVLGEHHLRNRVLSRAKR